MSCAFGAGPFEAASEVNAAGTLLALTVGETARDVLLVDAATGDTVDTLRGHRPVVRDLRFSHDGSLVGAAGGDFELIVWKTATGRLLERWPTVDDWGVGFGPDNDLVYGGGGVARLEALDDGIRKGLRVTFEDQGPGIADLDLALRDGYTSGGGLGLGLGGARRLVNEFELTSAPGEGTRVAITRWT